MKSLLRIGLALAIVACLTSTAQALTQNDKDHAQLSFCYGGLMVMRSIANQLNNPDMVVKVTVSLEKVAKKIHITEQAIINNPRNSDTWKDLIKLGREIQFKRGIRFVNIYGPSEFNLDLQRCTVLIENT